MSKEQGLSLLDIAVATELVEIGAEKPLKVRAISAKSMVAIFQRFPEIRSGATNGMKIGAMVAAAPDAVAAAIAAGLGHPGDADYEEKAGDLSVDIQLDLLEAIGRCTFRNGFGPFVKRIVAMADAANEAASANSGKDLATKLPQALKPSLPQATVAPTPGITAPAS